MSSLSSPSSSTFTVKPPSVKVKIHVPQDYTVNGSPINFTNDSYEAERSGLPSGVEGIRGAGVPDPQGNSACSTTADASATDKTLVYSNASHGSAIHVGPEISAGVEGIGNVGAPAPQGNRFCSVTAYVGPIDKSLGCLNASHGSDVHNGPFIPDSVTSPVVGQDGSGAASAADGQERAGQDVARAAAVANPVAYQERCWRRSWMKVENWWRPKKVWMDMQAAKVHRFFSRQPHAQG